MSCIECGKTRTPVTIAECNICSPNNKLKKPVVDKKKKKVNKVISNVTS